MVLKAEQMLKGHVLPGQMLPGQVLPGWISETPWKRGRERQKEKKMNEHKNVKCVKQEAPSQNNTKLQKKTENAKKTNIDMMQKNSKWTHTKKRAKKLTSL